jgi:hypothetical protein
LRDSIFLYIGSFRTSHYKGLSATCSTLALFCRTSRRRQWDYKIKRESCDRTAYLTGVSPWNVSQLLVVIQDDLCADVVGSIITMHKNNRTPSVALTNDGAAIVVASGVIQGEGIAMEAYSKSVEHVWTDLRNAGRASDPKLTCTAIADDGAFVGTFAGLQLVLDKLLEMCIQEGIDDCRRDSAPC